MSTVARIRVDLEWLLLSPDLLADRAAEPYCRPDDPVLIQHFSQQERAAIKTWLARIELSQEQIAAIVRPGEQRLGRYAERLLGYFLDAGPTHRGLATHLALRSKAAGGSTLGEIDALLTDSAGTRWHWELAVKFFLCISPLSSARVDEFIGPNRRDSLGKKIEKLMGRQLRQTPPAPWDQFHWQRAAFVRGMIFYRYGRIAPSCDALSPDHSRGWWIPEDAIEELSDDVYAPVPRLRWMAALPLTHPGSVLEGRRAVQVFLDSVRKPPSALALPGDAAEMLVRLRWSADGWVEQDRGFVVCWDGAARLLG